MQIMKRKNKSVQQARAIPAQVIGGHDSLMNRYGVDFAGSPLVTQGTDASQRKIESMLGGLDDSMMRQDSRSKRSVSTHVKQNQQPDQQVQDDLVANDEILAASPFEHDKDSTGRDQAISFGPGNKSKLD